MKSFEPDWTIDINRCLFFGTISKNLIIYPLTYTGRMGPEQTLGIIDTKSKVWSVEEIRRTRYNHVIVLMTFAEYERAFLDCERSGILLRYNNRGLI